jgi:hypothetical protein
MLKSCLKALIFVFLFSTLINVAHAGNNILTKIGTMDLAGNAYAEWWYTSENPMLGGVAAADSAVTVGIDGTDSEVTADSSGNWTYTPTTLTSGDHTMVITTGGETYSFTLHTGQELPDTIIAASGDESDVPATGSNQILGIVVSVTLFGAALAAFLKTSNINYAFEKRILKDFE